MKRVLITGGSGFIGRKLAQVLLARGDHVTVLTRDVEQSRKQLPGRVRCAAWSPEKEGPWFDELAVVDAVVHLAGASVLARWTPKNKQKIERSRVESTRLIVEAIGRAAHKPSVLVNASATGYYGPQSPDQELDETSAPGQGFLAEVCQRWEEAARAVSAHGVRDVEVRIGVVLGEGGGATKEMLLPFKMFVGGPIGDGKQVIPWVHRDDVVGILLLALDNPEVKGPINAVSPNSVTSRELAKAMGSVVNRPSWLSVPAFALNLVMGEASMMLLTGQRVYPRRAVEMGYEFHKARLVPALESILAPA